ncbi:oncoprotein-induced transcript 3 protein-like [Pecten maximus]|uniref:oncoprotein-induced transcript 3 protein-like n=1 Tax=Pecten maximus TaxID=6579 RepID=UPI001458580C|nr:oncoprotein-induced transcript 3 protein-like [Pecten maximus]
MMDNSLLLADIGEDIYVKLTTHVTSTDVKMRLDSCYTLPSPGAAENFKFYIIRNACVTDINTRVLYTSPHETKFMFRDFEYSTDHDNLYLYCTATFCNRTDHSYVCDQQCHHRALRSVLATTGGYLRRVTTSGAVRRRIGTGRAVVDEPDLTESSSHAQSKGIDGVIFIVSLGVVGLSVSIVLLVIQRRRKHKPRV